MMSRGYIHERRPATEVPAYTGSMRTISQIAGMFGLSRSTLLYYDAAGLFSASRRSAAGYRLYSEEDLARLKEIRLLRELGVPVEKIRKYLLWPKEGATPILLQRILAINDQIGVLRDQQGTILTLVEAEGLLKGARRHLKGKAGLGREVGITEENYRQVHRSFEKASPESHRRFLRHLGFSPKDIASLLREIKKRT
jgi:DNA-binding transcriptional MerR regulator